MRKQVKVVIDRPMGSVHPRYPELQYPVNYGYVPGVLGGDGQWQDAYVLGPESAAEEFSGELAAVIYREDDVEEKWVVVPAGVYLTETEIAERVFFQEQYFHFKVILRDQESSF